MCMRLRLNVGRCFCTPFFCWCTHVSTSHITMHPRHHTTTCRALKRNMQGQGDHVYFPGNCKTKKHPISATVHTWSGRETRIKPTPLLGQRNQVRKAVTGMWHVKGRVTQLVDHTLKAFDQLQFAHAATAAQRLQQSCHGGLFRGVGQCAMQRLRVNESVCVRLWVLMHENERSEWVQVALRNDEANGCKSLCATMIFNRVHNCASPSRHRKQVCYTHAPKHIQMYTLPTPQPTNPTCLTSS